MSKQETQPLSQPQKIQQTVQTQPVKVEAKPQARASQPDKNVEVPKYVCSANERPED